MVGDWVLLFDKTPVKVDCIWNVEVYLTEPIGQHELDWRVTYEHIKPIPLTDKILEKNGFIRREDLVERIDEPLPFIYLREETLEGIVVKWRDSYDNGFRDENMECWDEYWEMCVDGISARFEKTANTLYVHELQHALRLARIDKEIVL